MTMKLPIDHEGVAAPVVHTFDPAKRYRYTWPGQSEKTVGGEEIAAIIKGANADMLNLKDEGGAPLTFEPAPKAKTKTQLEAEAADTAPALDEKK